MKAFYLPLILLVSILGFTILGNVSVAEKLSVFLWILLSTLVLIKLLIVSGKDLLTLFNSITTSTFDVMDKYLEKKRLVFFSLLFLSLLLSLSSTLFLGGDDTRTYFKYPLDYYINFSSNIASNNAFSGLVGFLPPPSISVFVLHLAVIKSVLGFINLQAFYYALNISLGFFFFMELMKQLLGVKLRYMNIAYAVCGIFYVFSQFNIYTVYSSQTLGMFVVSVLPICLYLFTRSVIEKKPHFVILIALILSVFSMFAVALPWFAGAVIIVSPIAFYICIKEPRRSILYLLLLSAAFLIFNLNWLLLLKNSPVVQNTVGVTSSIASQAYREENKAGIISTVTHNNPLEAVLNVFPGGLQKAFNWTYLPIYRDWYSKILFVNVLMVLTFGLGVVTFHKHKPNRTLYLTGLASFVLAIYLFIVNFGTIGIDLFIYLTEKVPGFVMFRNMYDKFGVGLSFAYSFFLSLSIYMLFSKTRSITIKRAYLSLLFMVLFINIKPVIFNEFSKAPIWTTEGTYGTIESLNDDFLKLIDFMKEQNTDARYLVVPLASGNIFPIQDKYKPDHYYAGVSPLLMLTGKNDYSGIMSFGSLGVKFRDYLAEKDYEEMLYFLKHMNVGFVIVNKDISNDLRKSYMYSGGLVEAQDSEFLDSLLGEKIMDFGDRYTLYAVKDQYKPEKVSVSGGSNTRVTYIRHGDHEYEVTVENVVDSVDIVLLEPFSNAWIVKGVNGQEIKGLNQSVAFDYATKWTIDLNSFSNLSPDSVKLNEDGTRDLRISLYYKPYDLYMITTYISYFFIVMSIPLFIFLYKKYE